jgi:hypothetical protein
MLSENICMAVRLPIRDYLLKISNEVVMNINYYYCPPGRLIAPVYGKLTPDQVFSSSTPVNGQPVTPVGAHGGSSLCSKYDCLSLYCY